MNISGAIWASRRMSSKRRGSSNEIPCADAALKNLSGSEKHAHVAGSAGFGASGGGVARNRRKNNVAQILDALEDARLFFNDRSSDPVGRQGVMRVGDGGMAILADVLDPVVQRGDHLGLGIHETVGEQARGEACDFLGAEQGEGTAVVDEDGAQGLRRIIGNEDGLADLEALRPHVGGEDAPEIGTVDDAREHARRQELVERAPWRRDETRGEVDAGVGPDEAPGRTDPHLGMRVDEPVWNVDRRPGGNGKAEILIDGVAQSFKTHAYSRARPMHPLDDVAFAVAGFDEGGLRFALHLANEIDCVNCATGTGDHDSLAQSLLCSRARPSPMNCDLPPRSLGLRALLALQPSFNSEGYGSGREVIRVTRSITKVPARVYWRVSY